LAALSKLSVFGLGKLGACLAATLADRGFEVLGVDVDAEAVRKLAAGEPPVDEPRLADTIARARPRLRATTRPEEAVATDASFFVVPTPSLADGSFSNEFVMRAMRPLAQALRGAKKTGHLFVLSSTTTPGACRQVLIPMLEQQIGGICGRDFGFCYNPEFIALGDVIRGLLEPDLVLIGEADAKSGAALAALYERYTTHQPEIARMSVTSAELAKISVNSFVTAKISFTNQLRLISERLPDTDVHAILRAIGTDSRIGHAFLRAGTSYGGPCFPRDNRLLAYTARSAGTSAPLAEATDRVNELAKERLAQDVLACVREGEKVLVLGMAYRPDTHIVEESAGLHVAQALRRSGRRVLVHDCAANGLSSPSLLEFEIVSEPARLAHDASLRAVVICCPWAAYEKLSLPPQAKVFDPWGVRS
jgi:UDPglucose 6-dehydrogenase